MKIVIDISERAFEFVKENGLKDIFAIDDAIRKGVILPEGHGRLIDADKMIEDLQQIRTEDNANAIDWACNIADSSRILIDADAEGAGNGEEA